MTMENEIKILVSRRSHGLNIKMGNGNRNEIQKGRKKGVLFIICKIFIFFWCYSTFLGNNTQESMKTRHHWLLPLWY